MVKLPMLLVALLLPGAAQALESGAPETGARLAGGCQGCHGAAGLGGQGLPPLAGTYRPAELAALLRGFRDNSQPATVMGRIARGYDDSEIAALAAFYGRRD